MQPFDSHKSTKRLFFQQTANSNFLHHQFSVTNFICQSCNRSIQKAIIVKMGLKIPRLRRLKWMQLWSWIFMMCEGKRKDAAADLFCCDLRYTVVVGGVGAADRHHWSPLDSCGHGHAIHSSTIRQNTTVFDLFFTSFADIFAPSFSS